MKIYKSIIILVLLSFPFGELLRIDLGSNIAIRPIDIFAGIGLVSLIGNILIKRRAPDNFLTIPVGIFFLIAFLSLVLNIGAYNVNQILIASLYLLRWISYASVFFILFQQNNNFKKTVKKILILEGSIILAFGYFQYFLYPNLRNLFYLGWDEHNFRMFSVFLDPNFAGVFFVLYMLFCMGLLTQKELVKNSKLKTFIIISIVFTFGAIFLTYSRSAVAMLIVGLVSFAILVHKTKYLIVLFFAVLVIMISLIPTFNKENTNFFRTASSYARVESYSNALRISRDHMLFGVGFNTYRYAQQDYGFKRAIAKFPAHADAGVDNSFIFLIATTGIIGLTAYANILLSIIKFAKNSYKSENNILGVSVIVSLIGLVVGSLFINSLFFPSIMLWIWIFLGTFQA